MKYRPQRGSLEESMKEVVEIEPPTVGALAKYLNVRAHRLKFKLYAYDERIDWYTGIVTIDGQAVGFTDRLI